jgi:phosphoserine phosphatase
MEYCTKPIAVDPDDKLKKVANKNKWEIISLR